MALSRDKSTFHYPPTDAAGTAVCIDAYANAVAAYSTEPGMPADTVADLVDAAFAYIQSTPAICNSGGDVDEAVQGAIDRLYASIRAASEMVLAHSGPDPDIAVACSLLGAAWADVRMRQRCPDCGVTHSNGAAHICVTYDGPPCKMCGKPTVFVMIGAPGVGQGQACPDGHYDGTCRAHATRGALMALKRSQKSRVGPVPACDFCGQPAIFDGKTTFGGWANMCAMDYALHGIGLGIGRGWRLS